MKATTKSIQQYWKHYFETRDPQHMQDGAPLRSTMKPEESKTINMLTSVTRSACLLTNICFPKKTFHAAFCAALDQVQEHKILPSGLGIRPPEWEDGYPVIRPSTLYVPTHPIPTSIPRQASSYPVVALPIPAIYVQYMQRLPGLLLTFRYCIMSHNIALCRTTSHCHQTPLVITHSHL
jgi:hypothetical protein